MSEQFPLAAEAISLSWRIREGGISVSAFTDETGLPYICLGPLNWEGNVAAAPVCFQRPRLMANLVAGFRSSGPIVVFLDAEASARGLELTISPPLFIMERGYERHKFAAWGIETPRYSMISGAANGNQPVLVLDSPQLDTCGFGFSAKEKKNGKN